MIKSRELLRERTAANELIESSLEFIKTSDARCFAFTRIPRD